MALLVAVIVTLFATTFGKPQYLVATNGVVTPHYYQQPLTYFYPGMSRQTNIHANPLLVPYTYPVNFAASSVVQTPKIQPYWLTDHCEKLWDNMEDLFNIFDANLDGQVTWAEYQNIRISGQNIDPRVIEIWKEVFLHSSWNTVDTTEVEGSADDKYNEGLVRQLFLKNALLFMPNDALDIFGLFNMIGNLFDNEVFFKPYDANLDYYLDKTEFDNMILKITKQSPEFIFSNNQNYFAFVEFLVESDDGKLSVSEVLGKEGVVRHLDEWLEGSIFDSGFDICAKEKIRG